MGKAATIFKDIGKTCSDLLGKDYKVGKTTVEVKSKTSTGVTFTPTATKAGEAVAGDLKAEYTIGGLGDLEVVAKTNGGLSMSLEAADLLTNGLTITAECERAAAGKPGLLASANLIAEYKSELFSSKSSYDIYKKDLLANVSTVVSGIILGADCTYCTRKSAVQKYALACQFDQPDFIVFGKLDDKSGNKTLSCSYYHKVSSDMQLGVNLGKPLAKPDVDIEFGCAYKLDKDTTAKAKVNSDGILCTSFKQKINAMTTMTLAAQVDTVNLGDNKHKFGLELKLAP